MGPTKNAYLVRTSYEWHWFSWREIQPHRIWNPRQRISFDYKNNSQCTWDWSGRVFGYSMTTEPKSFADLYEATADSHTSGATLKEAEYPAYFAALEAARIIAGGRRDNRSKNIGIRRELFKTTQHHVHVGCANPSRGHRRWRDLCRGGPASLSMVTGAAGVHSLHR